MPLLVCPNDNAAMQTVSRSGVEFDFCPTCRGVWLDRGELEKLMSGAADDEPPRAALRDAAAISEGSTEGRIASRSAEIGLASSIASSPPPNSRAWARGMKE